MWLSRRLAENETENGAACGRITLSNGAVLEADADAVTRGVTQYAPYGYAALPPVGETVLMLPAAGKNAVLGTQCKTNSAVPGEISITSLGGARIVLKNDGSVVINGAFIINKEGEIVSDI